MSVSTQDEPGFKRLHRAPKRAWRGATLEAMTPQGRWLFKQSEARFVRRQDAYYLTPVLFGELGSVGSFRFIVSDPDYLTAAE